MKPRRLILIMIEDSQQNRTQIDGSIPRVNEVNTSHLKEKISYLTTFVCQMVVVQL